MDSENDSSANHLVGRVRDPPGDICDRVYEYCTYKTAGIQQKSVSRRRPTTIPHHVWKRSRGVRLAFSSCSE